MGWSFNTTSQPKKSFIADLTQGAEMVRVVGNHVWSIFTAGKEGDRHKVVVLCLIKSDRGCWGYKDMDESSYPYYFTCPLSLLKQSELRSDNAKQWAEKVRQYHRIKAAERKATIEVGKSYPLSNGKGTAEILYTYRKAWAALYPCGTVYKVSKRDFVWA